MIIYDNLDAFKNDLKWFLSPTTLSFFTNCKVSCFKYYCFINNIPKGKKFDLSIVKNYLDFIFEEMGVIKPKWSTTIQEHSLPFLALIPNIGLTIIYKKSSQGWLCSSRQREFYYAVNPIGHIHLISLIMLKDKVTSKSSSKILKVVSQKRTLTFFLIFISLLLYIQSQHHYISHLFHQPFNKEIFDSNKTNIINKAVKTLPEKKEIYTRLELLSMQNTFDKSNTKILLEDILPILIPVSAESFTKESVNPESDLQKQLHSISIKLLYDIINNSSIVKEMIIESHIATNDKAKDSSQKNLGLSQRRANKVKDYFIYEAQKHDMPIELIKEKIKAIGFGTLQSISSTQDDEQSLSSSRIIIKFIY